MRYYSKQHKADILLKNPILRPHIPESKVFYAEYILKDMLDRHTCVYIKPDRGSKGNGIYKVFKNPYGVTIQAANGFEDDFSRYPNVPTKRYIVQKAVQLIELDDKKMDIRTIVQRPGTKWIYQGIVCKLANNNKIVTNYCQGAKPINALQAILAVTGDKKKAMQLLRKLRSLSLEIANTYSQKYSFLSHIGIDFAIDTNHHIWMIELNTKPGIQMFKKMKSQNMYKRMYRNRKYLQHRHRVREVI